VETGDRGIDVQERLKFSRHIGENADTL